MIIKTIDGWVSEKNCLWFDQSQLLTLCCQSLFFFLSLDLIPEISSLLLISSITSFILFILSSTNTISTYHMPGTPLGTNRPLPILFWQGLCHVAIASCEGGWEIMHFYFTASTVEEKQRRKQLKLVLNGSTYIFLQLFTNKILNQIWTQIWQQELFSCLLESADTLHWFSTIFLIAQAKNFGVTFDFCLLVTPCIQFMSGPVKQDLQNTSHLHCYHPSPSIHQLSSALLQQPLNWAPCFLSCLPLNILHNTARVILSKYIYDHATPLLAMLKLLLIPFKIKSSKERMIFLINDAGSNGYPYL